MIDRAATSHGRMCRICRFVSASQRSGWKCAHRPMRPLSTTIESLEEDGEAVPAAGAYEMIEV